MSEEREKKLVLWGHGLSSKLTSYESGLLEEEEKRLVVMIHTNTEKNLERESKRVT